MSTKTPDQHRRSLLMAAAVLIIVALILALPLEMKIPAFILVLACSLGFGIASWWIQQRHVQLPAPIRMWGRRLRERFFVPSTSAAKKVVTSTAHFFARCLELLNGRNRGFVIGIALIGCAQYLLSQRSPVVLRFMFADSLNRTFRIDPSNIDNLLLAVVLLIVAAVYIIRTLGPVPSESVPPPETVEFPSLTALARLLVIPLTIAAVLFAALLWELGQTRRSDSLVVIWIIVLSVLAFFGLIYDRRAGTPLAFKINRWDMLFILLIFGGGLVVGSYQLDRLPNSMMGDEGAFLLQAKDVALNVSSQGFFDLGVYSFPQASSLYQGFIMKLFGVSLWGWRFSSVLAGVLAVIPTYLLALALFDRRMAVLACTVMVLTPWFITFDRMGFNNSQAIFPVALTAYLLVVAIQRKSVFYSILSGIAGGLGFYTYSAGRLGVVFGVSYILYIIVVARRTAISQQVPEELKKAAFQGIRKFWQLGAAFVIAALVCIAPLWVYGYAKDPVAMSAKTIESLFPNTMYALRFYDSDQLFRDVPPITIDNHTLFFRADLYGMLLLRGFVRSMLAFQEAELVSSRYLAAPLAGAVGAVFYFIGLVVASTRVKDKKYGLILIWFVTGMLFLSIINAYPPRAEHMIAIIPAMAILIAFGIETCVSFVSEHLPLNRPVVVTVLTIASLGSVVFVNIQNYFYEVPRIYVPDPESIMAFAALQLQEPRNMIYVSDDSNPRPVAPFLVRYLPNKARFLAVTRGQFLSDQYVIQPGEDYTFFFLPNLAGTVVPFLERAFHEDGITPETYTDNRGRVVLLSWSFDHRVLRQGE